MKEAYLIGGQQKSDRSLIENNQDWYQYQKGVVLQVDLEQSTIAQCFEYVSPLSVRAESDPVLFKAGSIEDNRLFLCTQTEVIIFKVPGFERIGYISLPCFNDLHHVRPAKDGNLIIANSGLEMVMEVTPTGKVVREWNVLGEDPWEHFSKTVDYRFGINLKPHQAHPNHIFYIGDEIWVTRFEQRDAVSLKDPNRRLLAGIERVHDGVYLNGQVYLTTVHGSLVIFNSETLEVDEMIDLRSMHDKDVLLGWCRGLLIEDGKAWVGFSRIRPTKFRQAVSWVRQGFNKSLPSHIACYDLQRKQCVAEIDVEAFGLNAIFSILPCSSHQKGVEGK